VVTPHVETSPDRSDFAKLGEIIAASLVQAQEHANHASVGRPRAKPTRLTRNRHRKIKRAAGLWARNARRHPRRQTSNAFRAANANMIVVWLALLRQCLGQMGATPSDASKVSLPDDDEATLPIGTSTRLLNDRLSSDSLNGIFTVAALQDLPASET
jgi:hypothetical protein